MSYYTKITTAGLVALTAAMNSNTKVPISYMAFGDGNGNIPEPNEDAVSLVNEVYRVGVNKVEVHSKNPNWLVCEAIIPSAVGGFNIREVALFDNTGTKMLAVASYPPTYKPTVEEGAAKIQTIRIVLQVDNTGNFELIIDPDVVLATAELVDRRISEELFNFKKKNTVSSLSDIGHIQGLKDDDVVFVIETKSFYACKSNVVADGYLDRQTADGKTLVLLHNGEVKFEQIGSTAIGLKTALEKDPTITKVKGKELVVNSILSLHRGNIDLSFDKVTYPAIISGEDSPLSGCIEFKGSVTNDNLDKYILVSDLPEFSEQFPVSDIRKFNVGDWILISNNTNPQKINYMVRVLELNVDRIKVDYRLGWSLKAGDTLNYKKVNPLGNVEFSAKSFKYNVTDARETARSCVVLNYVYDSKVTGIEFDNPFWPCVAARFTHRCKVKSNKLNNPQSTQTGGDGYLVQWSASLYMETSDNISHGDRHLHDVTMGAYGICKNNRSFNSEDGGFVTHGAFEHDMYYENNTGVLSFANSGATYGERAKRITVNNHNAEKLIASAGIIDLTLNDVTVQGQATIALDGFQAKSLSVHGGVSFTNRLAKESKRKNLWVGGYIYHLPSISFFTNSSNGEISFHGTHIENFYKSTMNGSIDILFNECKLAGLANGDINLVTSRSLTIKGGEAIDIGFRFFNGNDQSCSVQGTKVTGSPTSGGAFVDNRKTSGNMNITINELESNLTSGFHWSVTQAAGSCKMSVKGGTYKNGGIRFNQVVADLVNSYLVVKDTIEIDCTRTLPNTSDRVKLADSLILSTV